MAHVNFNGIKSGFFQLGTKKTRGFGFTGAAPFAYSFIHLAASAGLTAPPPTETTFPPNSPAKSLNAVT